jgi:GNAT superfamily N-acetyltransferase
VDDLETVYHLLGGAFGVPVDTVRDVDQGMLGEPGVRVHLAEAAGPVSTCISWRSGVSCLIFAMATAPERQRQGAGRATLSHVMMEALQDGVERFILTSSAAGEPLYRSMGFETIETTERWTIIPDHRGLLAAPRA